MGEPIRYQCEITPGFLDLAATQLRAAMLARHDQVVPARREQLRPLFSVLRFAGLGLAALGIVLAGYGIAVAPDTACSRDVLVQYHLAMVLFVIGATFFWFLPRLTTAWADWARGFLERRAPTMLAALRKRAPYTVAYVISGGRLETRAEKLGLLRQTELRSIGAAVVAPALACLYGGRRSTWLRRVIYFQDPEARRAVLEALRGAGSEVVEVTGV